MTISRYGRLKMAQAVKMLQPKGGETEAMAACRVMTMPRWMGSIPASMAMG